jgi:hypothetical protein
MLGWCLAQRIGIRLADLTPGNSVSIHADLAYIRRGSCWQCCIATVGVGGVRVSMAQGVIIGPGPQ